MLMTDNTSCPEGAQSASLLNMHSRREHISLAGTLIANESRDEMRRHFGEARSARNETNGLLKDAQLYV